MTLPEVINADAPSELITFGEIAKLCADRWNRTILENEAWKRREWEALGKLLEAMFNDRLGPVQIESSGMTELDATERSGSLSNFLKERLYKWLRIKFQLIGEIVCRPPEWGELVSNRHAQALADAYIRPCRISRTAAYSWLRTQNIHADKEPKKHPPTQSLRKVGRPRAKTQLELSRELLADLRKSPQKARTRLGLQNGQKIWKRDIAKFISNEIRLKHDETIAAKTIINKLGSELQKTLDALN
jgi:hypothetical protein